MGYNKKRRNQLKSGKSQKFFLLTLLLMRAQTRPPLQVPPPTFPSVLSCTCRTNQSLPKANNMESERDNSKLCLLVIPLQCWGPWLRCWTCWPRSSCSFRRSERFVRRWWRYWLRSSTWKPHTRRNYNHPPLPLFGNLIFECLLFKLNFILISTHHLRMPTHKCFLDHADPRSLLAQSPALWRFSVHQLSCRHLKAIEKRMKVLQFKRIVQATCRSPWRTVNVNFVRFMAHGVGLDQICHVGLVKHADPCNFRVICHSDAADVVVTSSCHFASAPSSMAWIKLRRN